MSSEGHRGMCDGLRFFERFKKLNFSNPFVAKRKWL